MNNQEQAIQHINSEEISLLELTQLKQQVEKKIKEWGTTSKTYRIM